MALEWFIVFITALVSTRMTNKLKRARKNQKEGEFIPLDESETDSEDWEKTVEGAKEIAAKSSSASKGKGPVYGKAKTTTTAAEKGKAPMQPTSMKRKTVARKRGRSRGIEIEEPLASEPDETPTPPRSKRPSTSSRQATTATAAPATAATAQAASGPTLFETSDDDASVTSIYREQQGPSSEQERLLIEQGRISLLDLQKISADLVVLKKGYNSMKKEYNSIAKLVKKIFAKIGCSSSEDSDSG